jgi:hypothetical protein
MENVGGKEFNRHGGYGQDKGENPPGSVADSRRKDKGQTAGTAAAGDQAA